MPASLNALPPPSVEWRRESDEERKQRLERAGVLDTRAAGGAVPPAQTSSESSVLDDVARFKQQAETHRRENKSNFMLWWAVDTARWRALRSPRGTSTLADGSYAIALELTHPRWLLGRAQVSFGPKAVFYNGGQYAQLDDPTFSGSGYADFSSSELGLVTSLYKPGREFEFGGALYWSFGATYTPVRWVEAKRTSSSGFIERSDTRSKVGLNLPGLGFQTGLGLNWQEFLRAELFAAVHGAWPVQLRLRTGVQFSMGLSIDERSLASR